MRQFRLPHAVSLAVAVMALAVVAAPPTVQDQFTNMSENTTLTVDAPGVLTGAADIDGDPFTALLDNADPGFVVQVNTNGSYSYTPPAGFVGSNCFTFVATDGVETSTTAQVCVVVTGPTASPDSYATLQEDELHVPAPGVLGNDTNSPSGALTAVLVSPPFHGTVTLNPDGSFDYAPDANYNSAFLFGSIPDSFQYMATDGVATSAVGTVFITVEPLAGVGDVVLGVRAMQFRQLRNRLNRDRFSINGHVNPRGADANLSNATLVLEVNDVPLGLPVMLDAKGRGTSVSSNNVQVRASFNSATGNFTVRVANLALAPVLGIPDATIFNVVIFPFVKVKITGANLAIPAFTGFFQMPYATLAGRYSFGRYKTRLHSTFSGEFSSLRTQAEQVGTNFSVSCVGTIAPEGVNLLQAGNAIRLTIGQQIINIPSNSVFGKSEIALKKDVVADLTRFALSARRQSFQFQTGPLTGTGIPLAANGAPTIFDLPLSLAFLGTNVLNTTISTTITNSTTNVVTNVVVSVSTNTYRTTIELKRPDPQSLKWSR